MFGDILNKSARVSDSTVALLEDGSENRFSPATSESELSASFR